MASSTFPALILTTSSSWARGSDFIIISQTLNQVLCVSRKRPRNFHTCVEPQREKMPSEWRLERLGLVVPHV